MAYLTTKQSNFAALVASGMALGPAYIQAGYSCKKESSTAYGSRLMKNERVQEEIRRLRDEACTVSHLTIAEKRDFLARTVRGALYETPIDSDLIQEITEKTVYAKDGTKTVTRTFKLPSKLEALKVDNLLDPEYVPPAGVKLTNNNLLMTQKALGGGNVDDLEALEDKVAKWEKETMAKLGLPQGSKMPGEIIDVEEVAESA